MTNQAFEQGWTMLCGALGFLVPDIQKAIWHRALDDVSDQAWIAGLQSIIQSPDFREFYSRPRCLPSVSEIRAECEAKQPPPPLTPEQIEFRQRYFEQIERKRAARDQLTSGNAGHAALLRAGSDPTTALAKRLQDMPEAERPQMTESEWEQRRAELLRMSDALLGEGE